jgi:hypothetical protein
MNVLRFNPGGGVTVEPVRVKNVTLRSMFSHFMALLDRSPAGY